MRRIQSIRPATSSSDSTPLSTASLSNGRTAAAPMRRSCFHPGAAAGLGRLAVVAGDGVKIGANASKEANRTEAGLEKLAAQILAEAGAAA